MDKQDADMLERMVDKYSVAQLLESMSDICHAKGIHIAEHWQDVKLAKSWDRKGTRLARMRAEIIRYHTGDGDE